MTGLKYEEQGLNLFNEKILKLLLSFEDIFNKEDINFINYRIVMMNSDFDLKKVDLSSSK